MNFKLNFALLAIARYSFSTITISALLVQNLAALEVDREVMPRITIGGRTIITSDSYDYSKDLTGNKNENVNIDDSALLLRFDKHMYGVETGVAGTVIGFREVENKVVFHQLNAFYWNENISFRLGKTKLRNTIIELPTLRDEDLLDYSHVNTASSNLEFDQMYGTNIEFDWYFGKGNQSFGVWTGSRTNDSSNPNAPEGYDTQGYGFNYKPSEDLQYLNRIRHAGIIIDTQRVETATGSKWMQSAVAGVEFNININPISSWAMAVQVVNNNGIDGENELTTVSSRAKAKSNAQVISLRYTSRPKLLTRWQFAIAYATKKYDQITNAKNTSLITNFDYRLGQGVDLIAQLKQTDYSNDINNGNDETIVQFGISFQFDTVFNNTIGERNSILNLEHGYIQ